MDLRPGLTAEVKICVQSLRDVIQVPAQAVFDHGGMPYCLLADDQGYRCRRVTIGPTNEMAVVIRKGLDAGDQVVIDVPLYRDKLDMTESNQCTRQIDETL